VIDYPCAEFDDFSFSRFGFIVRTDSQTDTHRESLTDADDRYTHATTVGVSNHRSKVLEPCCGAAYTGSDS